MTTPTRIERSLPSILGDLAAGPTPDYIENVLVQTARKRQRPGWTFPERWLPMADIASRPAFAPRLPWRTIGVALVIIALVIVGTVVFIGSRQTRLPAPFGVAENGLIVYASGGDIYAVDPKTGETAAIVTGPETEGKPEYSLDGTKVAFMRRHELGAPTVYDVMAVNADGSNPHVISTEPVGLDTVMLWEPDSRHVILGTANGVVTRFDANGLTPPVAFEERFRFLAGEIRPPDGAQILFEPDSTPEVDLWIMNVDGTGARPLIPASALQGTDADLDQVRWSPDGSLIAFGCTPSDGSEGSRICIVNADGSAMRPLTDESGAWVETDLKWSPDGRTIAFNRWHQDPSGNWLVQPIGLAAIAGGPVRGIGPAPASEGALFDFSPDGTTLLSLPARFSGTEDANAAAAKPLEIDVATGDAHEVAWEVASDVSWQRLAP